MTFFFQTNPIGVILKIVLALLCVIIAVGGCFCLTAQKTSNKVCASIIKRASHSSGAWINLEALFASCSKSLCFCKRNIHISNVINTFLSLLLTVVRRNRSDGWCGTPLRYTSLASLFTGAKEAKFTYFSNGKPVSSWLISKSSDISLYKSLFCASSSWPLFCSLSAFVTNHATRHPPERLPLMTVRWCERDVFYYVWIWIFLTPRSRVRHVLLWMRALYLTACGLFNRNTRPLQW